MSENKRLLSPEATLVDAKRPLTFEITDEDVQNAFRLDKENCVIAQALKTIPGIKKIQVGTTVTRVATADQIVRYRTPNILRDALNNFDSSGQWDLPAGIYQVYPPAPHDQLNTIRKRNKEHPKRKRDYKSTGRNRPHFINPRVIAFSEMKKFEKRS